MLLLAVGLVRQTNADLAGVTLPGDGPAISERIKRLIVPARRTDILAQLQAQGEPALQSVKEALEAEGWTASQLDSAEDKVELTITARDGRPFVYRLSPRSRPLPAYTALEAPERRRSLAWMLAAQTNGETGFRDLTGFTVGQIANDVLTQLERWRLAEAHRKHG